MLVKKEDESFFPTGIQIYYKIFLQAEFLVLLKVSMFAKHRCAVQALFLHQSQYDRIVES